MAHSSTRPDDTPPPTDEPAQGTADDELIIDDVDDVDDLPLGPHPMAFLALFVIVLVGSFLATDLFVRHVGLASVAGGPELVDVPELIGTVEADALAQLADAGLEVEVTTAQNVNLPPGIVVDQNPPGGDRVISDTTVSIVVSIGDEFVRMPDLRGSPLDEMYLLLASHRLSFGDIGYQENDAAEDEVIGQMPAPGEVVPVDTAVHLMLSSGPPMVEIPDVRNLPEGEAIQLLAEAGFRVRTESRYSGYVQRDHAMSTAPDDEAPKGSIVVLYVSMGNRPTTTTAPPPPEPSTPTTSPSRGNNGNGVGPTRSSPDPSDSIG